MGGKNIVLAHKSGSIYMYETHTAGGKVTMEDLQELTNALSKTKLKWWHQAQAVVTDGDVRCLVHIKRALCAADTAEVAIVTNVVGLSIIDSRIFTVIIISHHCLTPRLPSMILTCTVRIILSPLTRSRRRRRRSSAVAEK